MVTITIKDVARETGFSLTTVSAVLRNKSRDLQIKPETERLILETADKLGYVRSSLALEMRTGQSSAIAILRPYRPFDFLFTATLQAEITAAQSGYSIRNIYVKEETGADFSAILDRIISLRPAALITCTDFGSNKKTLTECVRKHKLPWLSLDFHDPDADINAGTDDKGGIETAVGHLVSLGHTRIAHATDTLKAQYADVRFRAFCDSMHSRGMSVDESVCFHDYFLDDSTKLKQYAARIAAMKNPPTAICCGSDYMAVKLMMLLPRCGLRIPEDISLIAYGGLSVAALCEPVLTSVLQPFEQMTDLAIRELLKLVRKEPFLNEIKMVPVLKPGETVLPYKKCNNK